MSDAYHAGGQQHGDDYAPDLTAARRHTDGQVSQLRHEVTGAASKLTRRIAAAERTLNALVKIGDEIEAALLRLDQKRQATEAVLDGYTPTEITTSSGETLTVLARRRVQL